MTGPLVLTAATADALQELGEALGRALTVGDVGQTVEVTAVSPLLQTEGTQVGATVDTRSMAELPLGGVRTFAYLARLSPGVVPAEPGARDAAFGGFSVCSTTDRARCRE